MIGLSVLHAQYIRNNTKEIVLDTSTGLIWQDNNESKTLTKTWKGAIDYCEGLVFAGESDWRLPNINEFYSLFNRNKVNPALSSEFVNVNTNSSLAYWSSTTYIFKPSNAWYVHFYYGSGGDSDKLNNLIVRCVH